MPIAVPMDHQQPYPSNLTPLDVLRAARREILSSHGPCHASSEWLMHMTARRMINDAQAGPELRHRLLEDVMEILGTSHLRDEPDTAESSAASAPGHAENTPRPATGTDG